MKIAFLTSLGLGFLCLCLWYSSPSASPSAFAPRNNMVATFGKGQPGCGLESGYEEIHHTAERHLRYLLDRIGPSAGIDPSTYDVVLIRNRSGNEFINAMTCPDRRRIWISLGAWRALNDSESALALMLAHEVAHLHHQSVNVMLAGPLDYAERLLLDRLNYQQTLEVAVDRRAADILLRAGYPARAITGAVLHIERLSGRLDHPGYWPSHPSSRERARLMELYLQRLGHLPLTYDHPAYVS